jgi:hypothetical protein
MHEVTAAFPARGIGAASTESMIEQFIAAYACGISTVSQLGLRAMGMDCFLIDPSQTAEIAAGYRLSHLFDLRCSMPG